MSGKKLSEGISVIIPALNEEKTIAATVHECLKVRAVAEVIVVDDKSIDRTAVIARASGAKVITSDIRGKGKSMEDGLKVISGNIIVFVDADIKNFSHNMVDAIVAPILENKCDFVKSTYGRKSGRVTELMARPLLSVLFPALVEFRQPLSGIIAGRTSFFMQVSFENDYGVDIGILIDMVNLGARIMEVDIGYIQHKMKPWRKLAGMSSEVARSILKRANMTNRMLQRGIIAEAEILGEMIGKGTDVALPIEKAAFIDVDGTLIQDRFIFSFAKEKSFHKELTNISGSAMESYAMTRAIASLMEGFHKDEISKFAGKMKLNSNVGILMKNLRENGYHPVLISDGYETVARSIARRIGVDTVIANRLQFEDGVCIGKVDVNPLFFPQGDSCAHHPVCKLNAAMNFCNLREIDFENTFAMGNSSFDACLLRFANISYAYQPVDRISASAAKYVISEMSEALVF